MADYIPSSDGLMRSTLRDTIKRLRRIRVKAGREDEEAEAESTGDPFQDELRVLITLISQTKVSIDERNEGCTENGQDRLAVEQSHEIRKQIHELDAILGELRKLLDDSQQRFDKESAKKKPTERKLELLRRELEERRVQYEESVRSVDAIKAKDLQSTTRPSGDAIGPADGNLGKKSQLRAQLKDLLRPAEGGGREGSAMKYVDDTVGGGRLEDQEETKQEMHTIAANNAQIDAGLDRLREGVHRLHNIANEINTELDAHNTLFEKTEVTIDKQNQQLRTINRSISRYMRQTKPLNCFLNICCVVLIIALIGLFLLQFKVI